MIMKNTIKTAVSVLILTMVITTVLFGSISAKADDGQSIKAMDSGDSTSTHNSPNVEEDEISFISEIYYLGTQMIIDWSLNSSSHGTIHLKDSSGHGVRNWMVIRGNGTLTYTLDSNDPTGIWTVTLSALDQQHEKGQSNYIIIDSDTTMVDIFSWLYIVYLAGDNNLEHFAYSKINSQLKPVGSTNGIGMFALVDYLEDGDSLEGSFAYYIEPNNLVEIPLSDINSTWVDEVNTGDGDTLADWTTYVLDKYPGSHEVLHIYDHGGLPPGEMCWDWSDGDIIDFHEDEFQDAIVRIAEHTSDSLIDVIMLDMCDQSTVEVGYEVRDLAMYVTAYETHGWAQSWPLRQVVESLVDNPDMTPEELAHVAVDHCGSSLTMGSFDLSFCRPLATALDNLVIELVEELSGPQRSYYLNILIDVIDDEDLPRFLTIQMDIYEFARILHDAVVDDRIRQFCQCIMDIIDDSVYCNDNPYSGGHGLSVLFPPDRACFLQNIYVQRYLSWPFDFREDTQWDEFMCTFFNHPLWPHDNIP